MALDPGKEARPSSFLQNSNENIGHIICHIANNEMQVGE